MTQEEATRKAKETTSAIFATLTPPSPGLKYLKDHEGSALPDVNKPLALS